MSVDDVLEKTSAGTNPADDGSVVVSVEVRVQPSEELKSGLVGENGTVDLTEDETVATAVGLAIADAPFDERHVPLEHVEVSLGSVTVRTEPPQPAG
ncbi:MAG: hypothetical protein JWR33_2168 [Naasia sp.]|uniref:hypothetical protein n=1 Tax=Naasia sp. TaxID=2546198 RepID=UPI00262A1D09|nr:hypothetical protein [Naasia sp.]MCU1571427.1 hypothetical protein [Naasia sp.]